MRPRTEVALALVAFALIALIALEAGSRRRGVVDTDPRTSTYLTGPRGLRGMAEVVERMGGTVKRWRGRAQALQRDARPGAILVVADPFVNLQPPDVVTMLEWTAAGGDLLLGGEGAARAMRCLGFTTRVRVLDSARVIAPSGRPGGWVHAVLRGIADSARTMGRGSLSMGGDETSCPTSITSMTGTDTLLRGDDGAPVAIRVTPVINRLTSSGVPTPASPGRVILLADMALLNNQGLREAGIPEYLLQEILGRNRLVVFDELHQGFGSEGSLPSVALAWSRSSPWGWLFWQAAIVGFLAFVAGAVRFGPMRTAIRRERRSPLEHVQALATALAAARGHDVAIASLVRGLRRRLQSRTGSDRSATAREPWPAWAGRLQQAARTPELRARAGALIQFASPGQPNSAVQDAANAVEDVWEALHR
jgi:hypothetical protein